MGDALGPPSLAPFCARHGGGDRPGMRMGLCPRPGKILGKSVRVGCIEAATVPQGKIVNFCFPN
jgi:hypothetical protein